MAATCVEMVETILTEIDVSLSWVVWGLTSEAHSVAGESFLTFMRIRDRRLYDWQLFGGAGAFGGTRV